jgi:hypothetical protein
VAPSGVSRWRPVVRGPVTGTPDLPSWGYRTLQRHHRPGSGTSVSRSPRALHANAPGFGVFPGPATRRSEERRGLSWASAPYRVSDRSLRPTRRRAGSSLGVSPPTTTPRAQVRFTRACLTRHLPASGFRPSRRLPPCERCRPESRRRPWGSPYRALIPSIGRARFRALALLPFPVLPAFSSEVEKVGSSAATPGLCSDRRAARSGGSYPPSRTMPSWGCLPSEALAPPRWSRLPGPSPPALHRHEYPKAVATAALQGLARRRGQANSRESAGSLGVCRLGLPCREARRPRDRAAVGASSEQPSPTAPPRVFGRARGSRGRERPPWGRLVKNSADVADPQFQVVWKSGFPGGGFSTSSRDRLECVLASARRFLPGNQGLRRMWSRRRRAAKKR